MNRHRNAALSLKGRRELCRRVVEGGRTLSETDRGRRGQRRCARKWAARYRAEGELGWWIARLRHIGYPHRASERRVQAIAALRRLPFTGPEIAEVLGMALSSVSGILTRIGMGKPVALDSSPLRAMSELVQVSRSTLMSRSLAVFGAAWASGSPASGATRGCGGGGCPVFCV